MNFIYLDNGHIQVTIQTDDIPDSGGAFNRLQSGRL